MSTVMGFPHEFRSNGPRKRRKSPQASGEASTSYTSGGGSGVVIPPFALEFSEDDDANWIEKLLSFMAAVWAKIVELEQKLIAAVERMAIPAQGERPANRVKDYYTTEELAREFGRKRETYEKALREGKLKGIKVAGRGRSGEWRVSMEEVARYRNEGYRRPDPPYFPGLE